MKFAFVTCVQLGLSCIEKIYASGGKLDLLITLHDYKAMKKSGRIYLDSFAAKHSIPLMKINHVNDEEVKHALKTHEIDILFIIGWSQIADRELIELPRNGAYGIHPTLLPEGRGRAAIPWAIIKGLKQTGVTMFKLDEGVDTGDIAAQQIIPLEERETASTLYRKVCAAHEDLIAKVYRDMLSGKIELRKQDHSMATEWQGRTPADGEIFPDTTTTEEAERLIRATTRPYPGAFMKTADGKMIIWEAVFSRAEDATNPLILKDGVLDILDCEFHPFA